MAGILFSGWGRGRGRATDLLDPQLQVEFGPSEGLLEDWGERRVMVRYSFPRLLPDDCKPPAGSRPVKATHPT